MLPVLEAADIPCGPVHNYETLLQDPENRRKRKLLGLRASTAGQVRTVSPGARFSETPMKMWRVTAQTRRAHRRSPARSRN